MGIWEVNQKKVLETRELLLEIIREPSSFNSTEELMRALKSQSGLAKFSDSNRDLNSCSLNTLKSASESLLDRGFVELDELRMNAKDAVEAVIINNKTTKVTRTGLKNKVNELESNLNTLKKSHFLLEMMINELRSELKNLAYSNDISEKKISRYLELNRRIEAKLSYIHHGDL